MSWLVGGVTRLFSNSSSIDEAAKAAEAIKAKDKEISDLAKSVLADLQYARFMITGTNSSKQIRNAINNTIEFAEEFFRFLPGVSTLESASQRNFNVKYLDGKRSDMSSVSTFFDQLKKGSGLMAALDSKGTSPQVSQFTSSLCTKLGMCQERYGEFITKINQESAKAIACAASSAVASSSGGSAFVNERVEAALRVHSEALGSVKELETIQEKVYEALLMRETKTQPSQIESTEVAIRSVRLLWDNQSVASVEFETRLKALNALIPILQLKELRIDLAQCEDEIVAAQANVEAALKSMLAFDYRVEKEKVVEEKEKFIEAQKQFKQSIATLEGAVAGRLSENSKALLGLKDKVEYSAATLTDLAQEDGIGEELQGKYLGFASVIRDTLAKTLTLSQQTLDLRKLFADYGAKLGEMVDFKADCITTGSDLRHTRLLVHDNGAQHHAVLATSNTKWDAIDKVSLHRTKEQVVGRGTGTQEQLQSPVIIEKAAELQAIGNQLINSSSVAKEWLKLQLAQVKNVCDANAVGSKSNFSELYMSETRFLASQGKLFDLVKKATVGLF